MRRLKLPETSYLLECFEVNLDEGELIWKTRPASHFLNSHGERITNSRCSGLLAGSVREDKSGLFYKHVSLNGKSYAVHRILFKLRTGKEPHSIDHLDGNGLNNKALNIVASDSLDNQKNVKHSCRNTSGVVGVSFQCGKWVARICENKVEKFLGAFLTIDEAVEARVSALRSSSFKPGHGTKR